MSNARERITFGDMASEHIVGDARRAAIHQHPGRCAPWWWEAKKKAQKSPLSEDGVLAVFDPKTLQSMQATNDACASNQVFSTNHPTPLAPATGG